MFFESLNLGARTRGDPFNAEYKKWEAMFAPFKFFAWITCGLHINGLASSGETVKESGAFPCCTAGGRLQAWPPRV